MQNKADSNDFDAEKESLLSIGDSADLLGVSVDTLRRWEKRDKIQAYRSPGGHRYFKKSELEELFGTRYERIDDSNDNKQETEKKESEPQKQVDAKTKPEEKDKESQHQKEQIKPRTNDAIKEEKDIKIPDLTPISVSTSKPSPQPPKQPLKQEGDKQALTNSQRQKVSEILSYQPSEKIVKETPTKETENSSWNIILGIFIFLFVLLDVFLFYIFFVTDTIISPVP
jgi:excisionase family DNA binding protein